MSINQKDRDLTARLAALWLSANVIAGRAAIAYEEGVLFAQQLLQVIDRRVGVPKGKKKP